MKFHRRRYIVHGRYLTAFQFFWAEVRRCLKSPRVPGWAKGLIALDVPLVPVWWALNLALVSVLFVPVVFFEGAPRAIEMFWYALIGDMGYGVFHWVSLRLYRLFVRTGMYALTEELVRVANSPSRVWRVRDPDE